MWRSVMGAQVNLYEAKTQLSKLVERAAQGEEIVIAKAGVPLARLVPLAPPRRQPGSWKGKVDVEALMAALDAPWPDEILEAFGMKP